MHQNLLIFKLNIAVSWSNWKGIFVKEKPSWLCAQDEATLNGSKMEQIHKYSPL